MKIVDVEFREIDKTSTNNKKLTRGLDKVNDTLLFVSIILGEVVLAVYAKNIFSYLTYRG